MADILVVDDDPQVLASFTETLARGGHDVQRAASGGEAIRLAAVNAPDLAIIDWRMPGRDGVATGETLRARQPALPMLLVTGFPCEREELDRVIRAGFAGLLVKPVRPSVLLERVGEVLTSRRAAAAGAAAHRQPPPARPAPADFEGMIGESPAMRRVFDAVVRAAGADAPLLVRGETGTGKELVARALHARSPRREHPFVAVNGAATPLSLFEAEAFGHERGAFTDAREAHRGWFEQAHRGTLFLDEIGEVAREAQAKLLRALETQQITRVGARRPTLVDVRVVAATNVDLEQAVERGSFRADLYFRLNALSIHLPPLRERPGDLAVLIDHCWTRLRAELQRPDVCLAAETRAALLAHDWPGNVRELEHTLRQALVNAAGSVVHVEDLPLGVPRGPSGLTPAEAPLPPGMSLSRALSEAKARAEAAWIAGALSAHEGHLGRTADALGMNRRTLHEKVLRYGLGRHAGPTARHGLD
jgi:DNA-binding NtrC family response regulator